MSYSHPGRHPSAPRLSLLGRIRRWFRALRPAKQPKKSDQPPNIYPLF